MSVNPARRRRAHRAWDTLSDDDLLDLRFCDLGLRLRATPLDAEVETLYGELARRGIAFRPHAWLSTEWFSPDGIPGIAIPFFLAHPRLRRLEQRMTGEPAEGGTRDERRKILRHEAGHALDTAYGLRRMASWRQTFGHASKPYPTDYQVRPGSRRYVLHLDYWYAQSHPTEDFAETFAVWLQPKARWRRDYRAWPALAKLEYVDALMAAIAGRRPRNRSRSAVLAIGDNRRTLRSHYRQRHLVFDGGERRYDRWLAGTFSGSRGSGKSAATAVREMAPKLHRRLLARGIAGAYLIDHVIGVLVRRLRRLDLRTSGSQRKLERLVTDLVEAMIADMLRRNREKYLL